jgi:hypothetical protein
MKSGGADVRVLNREPINPDGEDWRGKIIANARGIAEQASEEAPLVGYLVVGIFEDGCSSIGYRYDPKRCPIPRTLMPAWIAEVIRRDLITEVEAKTLFDDMFEWQDG